MKTVTHKTNSIYGRCMYTTYRMLNIVNLTSPVAEAEHPFKFPLDPFQKHAISAISKDENVLVTAKTGSGKTLVGEYQIYHSLKKGKRVFYTTPIKSLSNQKFYDLKQMFPSVGIMTGDIKYMPQADVVIMTTEILRNLLFKQGTSTESIGITANLSLVNLDSVVFDEVHYINDPDRGKVWEECLTLLPRDVNLVLLSATIAKPEKFAGWLGDIKEKPIHLISTEYRIVPLSHQLPDKSVVMDSKDVFNKKAYVDWYNRFYELEKQQDTHRDRVYARQEGDDAVKKGERTTSFVDRMNKLINELELPALFFVFSRKLCVEFAKKVSHDLLDSSDAASVRHIVKFHLHRYHELEKMAVYYELLPLLEKGIAYHHSGMLPILKEIIEILFSRGFIKVLFATETFAVGINMPTKVVVFTSYRKYDDKLDTHRMLTSSEYIQMAGRAGRRGKDDKGIVVYLPIREPEHPISVQTMMTGKKSEFGSKMDFGYSYILSAIQSGKNIVEQTYWAAEQREILKGLQSEIIEKKQQLMSIHQSIESQLDKRREIEDNLAGTVNAERKKWQAELGKWKNSHFTGAWDDAWKAYKSNRKLLSEIDGLECYYKEVSDFDSIIRSRMVVLEKMGFLKDGVLTQKGILASELHEGHPLLMSHAYTEKMLHDMSSQDIVKNLSVFLDDIQTEYSFEKLPFHLDMIAYSDTLFRVETIKSPDSYWKLSSYWADGVVEWISGNDFVCEQLGIEQGNFVRSMLKLSNIVEEWINLATISQDVEMIEKMKDVKNLIVRGFVIPDSLYLRI
jgi:superfamily II RNA helicase